MSLRSQETLQLHTLHKSTCNLTQQEKSAMENFQAVATVGHKRSVRSLIQACEAPKPQPKRKVRAFPKMKTVLPRNPPGSPVKPSPSIEAGSPLRQPRSPCSVLNPNTGSPSKRVLSDAQNSPNKRLKGKCSPRCGYRSKNMTASGSPLRSINKTMTMERIKGRKREVPVTRYQNPLMERNIASKTAPKRKPPPPPARCAPAVKKPQGFRSIPPERASSEPMNVSHQPPKKYPSVPDFQKKHAPVPERAGQSLSKSSRADSKTQVHALNSAINNLKNPQAVVTNESNISWDEEESGRAYLFAACCLHTRENIATVLFITPASGQGITTTTITWINGRGCHSWSHF